MVLRLLALPVTGPIRLIAMLAEEVEKEYYDPQKILAEFERLKAAHGRGEIEDADWKDMKTRLNERFRIAASRVEGR